MCSEIKQNIRIHPQVNWVIEKNLRIIFLIKWKNDIMDNINCKGSAVMEDKMFELMTKMYSDITNRLDKMDDKICSMDDRICSIDKKLDSKADKTDIVHIENKLDNNSKALFDGYNQVYDKVVVVENAVIELSSKVEKQEVEIKVIKGGK